MSTATPPPTVACYRQCLSVCMAVALCITSIPDVYAIENTLPATSVLGQDDGTVSDPQPIFLKGTANNGAHKLGLSLGSLTVGGLAMDTTDHRLFVTDTNNNRVLVYNLDVSNVLIDSIPDSVIGQPNFWSNAAGQTQAGLSVPLDLAFDDAGNRLFVVGNAANRVTVFDVTAITDGENAISVLGQTLFTNSTAATTQEGLNAPSGIAFDSTNNRLFVAQTTGNRVSVFDTATIADGEPAVSVLGQANFTTATAATTQVGMNVPYGVALSGSTLQTLFVAQGTGNRVTTYEVTAITDGENAVNVLGQANFTATTAATSQAGINAPRGIAYDAAAKKLYVAQATGNRVTVYNLADGISNGENAASVLGQANFSASTAATTQVGLNLAVGVYADSANSKLYVAQSTGNRVSLFDVTSITNGENAVDVLAQSDDNLLSPTPIYTKGTANNAALKIGMNAPWGVALDSVNHRLFVTDGTNNRVLVYNLTAENLLADRTPDNILGQVNYYSNTAATTQAGMSFPIALSFDAVGNRLFVVDNTNNRVVVYDTASITDGENATGVIGQLSFTLSTAAVTQDSIRLPRAAAYDSTSGLLYVTDFTDSRVMVFTGSTIVDGELAITVLGQDDGTVSAPQPIYTKSAANNAAHKLGLSAPIIGIVMDTVDHRLFVSDTTNNRVLVYNLDNSNVLLDRTPDNVLGQLNFYGNTAATTRGGVSAPNGLAYDPTGKRLFVATTSLNRVTIYDVTTITDGEDAINVLGQTSYLLATAATTQIGLNVPTGVTYDDATDRLYVAQNTGNRVTVYNLAAGYADYMNADNLLGQYDETSLTAPVPMYTRGATNNGPNKLGLSAPIIGITMDTTDHRLFVSDTSNNRVLIYNLDASNALLDRIPDNVLGQANFWGSTGSNTQIGLSAPNGLAYDSARKRLFVAVTSSNCVKTYDVTAITDGENAINVLGQTAFTTSTAATTQAGMNVPTGLVYDSTGQRLFVAQNTGNRVTVYDVAAITNGENATGVLGQATFTATTAATTQVGMNVPYDVTLSGTTLPTLFVSQGTGNRVTTYYLGDGITDGENAVAVLGQANFTATTAATTQAGMNAPRGIAYDAATKKLYVAQTTGNRVTVYDTAAITDGENAISVLGQANFTATAVGQTQLGFSAPTGVYIDSANSKLYVPQSGYNRVSIFDVASITDGENAVDLLGQYDDNVVTPGPIYTKSTVNNAPNIYGLATGVIGLTLDPTDHRLFVSDTSNNRVLIYNLDSNDLLIDRIPDHVLGQVDFHSNTAATTQAGLNVPNGLAYDDTNNRLFVAQTTGNRVTVYDVAAITDGENAINVLGQATFTATTAATTQAGMNVPTGLVYDSTGQRLFVAQNTGNRVTVYDVAAITDGENATGVLGQANFTTTTAATTQAGMNIPYDVTLSGSTLTTLFVSQDAGHRVTTYEVSTVTDGENAVNVLGQATFTATTAATTQVGMNAPRGISYDATNKRLYVAQTTGNRVTSYDVAAITDGENAVNVIGQSSFTLGTGACSQEGLFNPSGVLSDAAHNRVYVMDVCSRVLSYNTQVGIGNGENAVSVLGQATFTATTAATTQAGMNIPYDVALSGSTVLFVSQGTGNRVTAYNIGDGITDGENAINVLGQSTFTATTAATTQVGMNAPRGIAYDPTTKTLYVSQTTGNRVTTYDVAAITDGENAVKVLGQTSFTVTTATVSQSGLSAPNGVYIDSANSKLYVPQSGANRVSVFDVASIADGEYAVDVLGQTDNDLNPPGPVYINGTANNAPYKMGMSSPQGLAVDAVNHRLFVADTLYNRILVYNMTTGNILIDTIPDNVLGQPNFYSSTAATTQAGVSAPVGLAVDTTDNLLYVADSTNNRILVYDIASITNGENAVALEGQSSYTVSTAGTTQFGLSAPKQLAYDSTSGQLFVADSTNNRVISYLINPPTTSSSGGGDIFHFFGW